MPDLDAILTEHGSKFLAVIVAGDNDRVLAAYARRGLDQATLEAPLATVRRVFNNPDSRAALVDLAESVFYDLDGRRLVCRPLQLEGEIVLLIVLTPAEKAYRRDLNTLVREINRVWKQGQESG